MNESWLVEGVRVSFQQLHGGNPDWSLEQLTDLQDRIEDRLKKRDSEESSRDLEHAQLWLMHVKGLVLRDLGRLSQAIELLSRFTTIASERESGCDGGPGDCFLLDVVHSHVQMADALSQRGDFSEAIVWLARIHSRIRGSHPIIEEQNEKIEMLVNTFGRHLGYENLSKRISFRINFDMHSRFDMAQLWRPPLPSRGPLNDQFEEKLRRLDSEMDRRDVPHDSKLESLKRKIEIIDEWQRAAPYRTSLKGMRLAVRFRRAIEELELGRFDDFRRSWSKIFFEDVGLFEEAPEHVDLLRMLALLYYQLSIAIRDRLADPELPSEVALELSNTMVLSLHQANEEFLISKKVRPITQAVALLACDIKSLGISIAESSGNQEWAFHQRLRREQILNKILKRDPNNDRAQSMKRRWEGSTSSKGLIFARIVNLWIVSSWNWSITPIA